MDRLTKFFTSLGGVLASLAAVIGGAAALYVAFGSGGDQAPNGPDPPTPVDTTSDAAIEDWRAQVEEACRDFDRRVSELGPVPADQPGQIVRLQQLIPIVDTASNEIRALEEPHAIRDDVERFLDSMGEVIDLSQTMVNSYQIADAQTFNSARLEMQAAARDTDRLAAELELQECVDLN
jgi:hypothetical protein